VAVRAATTAEGSPVEAPGGGSRRGAVSSGVSSFVPCSVVASFAVPGITVAASVTASAVVASAVVASVVVPGSRVAPLAFSVAVALGSAVGGLSVTILAFLFSFEFVSCGVVGVDLFAMGLALFLGVLRPGW
jgi:hypothetical protein